MASLLITDDEWDLISDIFPEPKLMGRPTCDRRSVLNGIFGMLGTGAL